MPENSTNKMPFTLFSIPLVFNQQALLKHLHLQNKEKLREEFNNVVEEAQSLSCPQCGFLSYTVQEITPVSLSAGNRILYSTLFSRFLKTGDIIYPFLVTSGKALEDWALAFDDRLLRFWADTLLEQSMQAAVAALLDQLKLLSEINNWVLLTPGSIAQFKLEEQITLFDLIHDLSQATGVWLNEQLFMIPRKSISGVAFPASETFESCQLCDRTCSQRRSAFDFSLEKTFPVQTVGETSFSPMYCSLHHFKM